MGHHSGKQALMPILYEYYNKVSVPDRVNLRSYLCQVWQERQAVFGNDALGEENGMETVDDPYQPFLSFDGAEIRARNYVGFIQLGDWHLEIYPKVFKGLDISPIRVIRHLFFWFDYCRKWKLPFSSAHLQDLEEMPLPELIIFLMATTTYETVSSMPMSMYNAMEEATTAPRGKIDLTRYLSTGFVNGNQHLIDCAFESFEFDNRLNQIIKYTCRLLLSRARFGETQRVLEELLFLLDEVSDHPAHYSELDRIQLSPLFAGYEVVKDICSAVLRQVLYSNEAYDLRHWCLLLPMEYIFEGFVAGFFERHFFRDWMVDYQKSDLNLSSQPAAFQLRHDIFLSRLGKPAVKWIVDAKYKLRGKDFKRDKKKGIAQADMYQMVSYALRRGVQNILVLYPNQEETVSEPDEFTIESAFPGRDKIRIVAAEIPFWSSSGPAGLSNRLEPVLRNLLEQTMG